MEGNSRAKRPAKAQCVVTRQPSSSPASAARNAPVQTVTMRRAMPVTALIQLTKSALARAASTPPPPGSTTVSMESLGSGSGVASNARPVAVVSGRPSTDDTATSYPPSVSSEAPANTSWGPTTSRACTPGKPTSTTLRAMRLVFARPGHVVYVRYPTI